MDELGKFLEVDTDNEVVKLNGQLLMPQNNQEGLGPVPYVIETGVETYVSNTSSITWNFEKRSDGVAECYGLARFTNVNCTTSAFGGYLSNSDLGVEFPQGLFSSEPTVSVIAGGSDGSGYAKIVRVLTAKSELTDNIEIKMRFVNSTSNSNKDSIDAYIVAKGRWNPIE